MSASTLKHLLSNAREQSDPPVKPLKIRTGVNDSKVMDGLHPLGYEEAPAEEPHSDCQAADGSVATLENISIRITQRMCLVLEEAQHPADRLMWQHTRSQPY
jgi:hypothetical protein